MLRFIFPLLLVHGFMAGDLFAAEPKINGPAIVYTVEEEFEYVKQDLVDAIEARGMVISYVSHASEMLARTADAAGVSENVYGSAEILLFCKSDLSHILVAANPHNIVMCPYMISVYTLAVAPDKVYLSIRNPMDVDDSYAAIHQLLESIINEVIDG